MKNQEFYNVAELEQQNDAALSDFDELISIATETCLSDPEGYARHLEEICDKNKKRDIVTQIWAKRAKLEMSRSEISRGDEVFYDLSQLSHQADMAKDSESIIPNASPDVQARIEAFGRSILEEAFSCLGEDALGKVSEFNGAESLDDQLAVIGWLLTRLEDIGYVTSSEPREYDEQLFMDVSEEDDGLSDQGFVLSAEPEYVALNDGEDGNNESLYDKFYHPIRLSPKILGVYPEMNGVEPTCLGYSILVASFFEKAGVDYMHAGVMSTAIESAMEYQYKMANHLVSELASDGISISGSFSDRLAQLMSSYESQLFEYGNQFHASAFVKMLDGSWTQLDPNFKSNVHLKSYESELVDLAYQTMAADNVDSLGVEFSFRQEDFDINWPLRDLLIWQLKNKTTYEDADRAIEEILASDDIIGTIRSFVMDEFHRAINEEPTFSEYDIMDSLLCDSLFDSGSSKYENIVHVFDEVVRSYVFGDIDEVGEDKIKHLLSEDTGYRQRRIDDLRAASVYVTMAFATRGINLHIERSSLPHIISEIGMPSYRIGASVLSDFALYTDFDIPFSFWASNWTSYVAFGNHMPDSGDDAQARLMHRMLDTFYATKNTATQDLSYYSSRYIINKFLEQEGK